MGASQTYLKVVGRQPAGIFQCVDFARLVSPHVESVSGGGSGGSLQRPRDRVLHMVHALAFIGGTQPQGLGVFASRQM